MGGLSFADGREWDCRSTLEHSSTLRLSSWSRLQKDIGQSVQNGLLVEIEHLSRLPLKRMVHQMEIGRSRLELVLETARFLIIGHRSQLCLRREWNFSSQSSRQRVNMKVMKDSSIFVGYFQTLLSLWIIHTFWSSAQTELLFGCGMSICSRGDQPEQTFSSSTQSPSQSHSCMEGRKPVPAGQVWL